VARGEIKAEVVVYMAKQQRLQFVRLEDISLYQLVHNPLWVMQQLDRSQIKQVLWGARKVALLQSQLLRAQTKG